MTDGFLSRWSKRKLDVQEGKPVLPGPALDAIPTPLSALTPVGRKESDTPEAPERRRETDASGQLPPISPTEGTETAPEVPLPTLEDAQALTPQSDFKPFMARGVASDVKNAAMKKLFADPHYNVMDRLDTYIDDYSLPDPIPEAMLRKMVSAKFLNLFDDDQKEAVKDAAGDRIASPPGPVEIAGARDDPDGAGAPAVAQSPPTLDAPPKYDENLDLRLQPDHAFGPQGAGRGAA